jgi:hypothetical protein
MTMLEKLAGLPIAGDLGAEEVAAYETKFRAHRAKWGACLEENLDRIRHGQYSLHWLDTSKTAWGTKVKPSSRGLLLQDINRPKVYGTPPEVATWRNFAPRGAVREPYKSRMPTIEEYDVLDKREVWSDNVEGLYEEAKARQWNASRDIPWNELAPVSEDLEKAACQLATFLTEVEFVAGDFPARWIHRIPNDFFETKFFLTTQMMDEARHAEVFRKRAIAGGGALMHSSPGFEWALKAILEAPTHTMGTFLLNVLGEGLVLTLFRAGEYIAKTHVDKEIFRRCMQDEARHVSYGTMQLKYYLDHHPNRAKAAEEMHRFMDVGEQIIITAFTESALLEPVAVLIGGGVDKIDQGMDGLVMIWGLFIEEYLQRCERAGIPRRERLTLPADYPWGKAKNEPGERVEGAMA